MPRKNRNARQPRTARAPQQSAPTETPTATPVARARTAAEDSLWAALYDQPGATSAELSAAAGIGKSTAGKILARWAGDGSVTRTAGNAERGRRAADRWSITEPDTDPDAAPVDTPQATDILDATQTTPAATDGEMTDDETADDTVVDDQPSAEPAPKPPKPAQPKPAKPPANSGTATDSGEGEKAPRLAPGALRGMVEDYLRDHPGEQFSPSAIGKVLNRSSGAVNNALEKLVTDGYAEQTQERPKRFAAKPHDGMKPAD